MDGQSLEHIENLDRVKAVLLDLLLQAELEGYALKSDQLTRADSTWEITAPCQPEVSAIIKPETTDTESLYYQIHNPYTSCPRQGAGTIFYILSALEIHK